MLRLTTEPRFQSVISYFKKTIVIPAHADCDWREKGEAMVQIQPWKIALPVSLWLMISPASNAANTVELASGLKWYCEGDLEVRLNDYSGHLWILSKSRKVDEKLPFYSCNSSHCSWSYGKGAEQCEEVPCAEILASENEQHLRIRLKTFEGNCRTDPTGAQN